VRIDRTACRCRSAPTCSPHTRAPPACPCSRCRSTNSKPGRSVVAARRRLAPRRRSSTSEPGGRVRGARRLPRWSRRRSPIGDGIPGDGHTPDYWNPVRSSSRQV